MKTETIMRPRFGPWSDAADAPAAFLRPQDDIEPPDPGWVRFGWRAPPSVLALPAATPDHAALLRPTFRLHGGEGPPDAILLLSPAALAEAIHLRSSAETFLSPIIDATGELGALADGRHQPVDPQNKAQIAALIERFTARRAQLAPAVTAATDLPTRLLAWLYVAGSTLRPQRDPASRRCFRYPGFFSEEGVVLAAEALVRQGLLDRSFIDRLNVCPSCHSSRLNVREECPSCRSANLQEQALVHHFRCAYQAPEAQFVRGFNLVCPKCRQHLRHYGSDYDKPGHVLACGHCHATNSEPVVGFACLDCGAHTDGDAIRRHDVFEYTLNAAAFERLTRPAPPAAPAPSTAGTALTIELARPLPLMATAELRYGARDRLIRERGEPAFLAMRQLFLQNLVSALEGEIAVCLGDAADHLVIRRIDPAVLGELGQPLLNACQASLSDRLEPRLRLAHAPEAAVPA
jgi:hypothetical protein